MHVPCPGPWAALGAPTCQGHWAPRTARLSSNAVLPSSSLDRGWAGGRGAGAWGRVLMSTGGAHGPAPLFPLPVPGPQRAPRGPTHPRPPESHAQATAQPPRLHGACSGSEGARLGSRVTISPPPPRPWASADPLGTRVPLLAGGVSGGSGGALSTLPGPPCPVGLWVLWAAPLLPRGERGSASPAEGAPVPRGPAGGGAGPDRRAPWAVVTVAPRRTLSCPSRKAWFPW